MQLLVSYNVDYRILILRARLEAEAEEEVEADGELGA